MSEEPEAPNPPPELTDIQKKIVYMTHYLAPTPEVSEEILPDE